VNQTCSRAGGQVPQSGLTFSDGRPHHTVRENSETILEVSRDTGLEISTEKTKYMIMSRLPNSGKNQIIRIANESFKNVAKFKYLGMTLTNQNNLLSSRLISKKPKD
jgi:hypothetical protein